MKRDFILEMAGLHLGSIHKFKRAAGVEPNMHFAYAFTWEIQVVGRERSDSRSGFDSF